MFALDALTLDALLASACPPQIFQAVVIEDEPYWDGGDRGNPSIWPIIYFCKSCDVVIVQVNPLTRAGVPHTAAEITNRLNEITFNSGLIGDMRAIAFVTRLLDSAVNHPKIARLKRLHMHMIENEKGMEELGVASR